MTWCMIGSCAASWTAKERVLISAQVKTATALTAHFRVGGRTAPTIFDFFGWSASLITASYLLFLAVLLYLELIFYD